MTHHSETIERNALMEYVRTQLEQADLPTLHRIVDLLDESLNAAHDPSGGHPLASTDQAGEAQQVSRRSFMQGAATAGLAGLALAAGSSAIAWGVSGRRTGQAIQSTAQGRLDQLQGLVKLYEQLEQVGLDQIVALGLGAVGGLVSAIALAAKVLRAGLDGGRAIVRSIVEGLPAIQAALGWASQIAGGLGEQLQNLEHTLQQTLNRAQPITDALGGFFNFIISHLPGSAGDQVRTALVQIGNLVNGLPDLTQGLGGKLLGPLSTDWFSTDPNKGLTARVVTPLQAQLLDPLEGHLNDLANLEQAWQTQMAGPIQQALDQRAAIRHQIQAYRADIRLV